MVGLKPLLKVLANKDLRYKFKDIKMFKSARRNEKKEFEEKVIEIDRVSRTVKGGKRMRFRALVVIGNRKGKVGMGIGKANEVAGAVTKAANQAKKHLITIPIVNDTIAHEIKFHFGGARIYLMPAKPGTSIIAGGSVRNVIELSGIKNILSKILGSSNKINNVKATLLALQSMKENASNIKIAKEKNDQTK